MAAVRVANTCGEAIMIALQPAPEAPAPVQWKPDIPLKERRQLVEEIGKKHLSNYDVSLSPKTVTHKGCDASPLMWEVELRKELLSVSGEPLVTLDLPYQAMLGRKPKRREILAVDAVVHLLIERHLYRSKPGHDGYLSLSYSSVAELLGKRMTSLGLYLARVCGVVETDCKWRRANYETGVPVGGKSIGYRFTEAALSWGFVVKRMPAKQEAVIRRQRRSRAARVGADPARKANFESLRKVTIGAAAVEALSQLSASPLKALHGTMAVIGIQRRQWYFVVGEKSGRCFHNVCSLPKEIRRHLLLDGQPTTEIDIASCQPLLLWLRVYGDEPGEEGAMMLYLIHSRKFYQTLCHWAGKADLAYVEQKKAVFSGVLYAKDRPNARFVAGLRANAPRMAAYIDAQRLRGLAGGRSLPAMLQRKEAEIMIDSLIPALRAQGIDSVSVHDAVVVPTVHATQVKAAIVEIFTRVGGIQPTVHCEPALATDTNSMQPITEKAGVVSIVAREPVAPACPDDLCPHCWAERRMIPRRSYFGCAHFPPSPVNLHPYHEIQAEA